MTETVKKYKGLFVTSNGTFFVDSELKYEFPLTRIYRAKKRNLEKTWDGYLHIKFPNSRYATPVHRIMGKLFCTNPCPTKFNVVDHINGIRSDNRESNLRWVNNHLNSINRPPTGIKFLYFRNWRANLTCKKQTYRIGCFPTYNLAYSACLVAKKILFDSEYEKYLVKYKNETVQKETQA
jgi:hypothetical protein